MSYLFFPNPTPVFPVLPPLAYSVHKKPIMASRVTTAITGRENKLACCVYPRWAFTLTYGGESWLRDQTQNISPDPYLVGYTELEQLSGLFLQCLGSYGEFFYSDPDDCSRSDVAAGVPNINGQGNVTDGTTTIWPLYVPWGSGPFTGYPMMFPAGGIASIDAVYLNGTMQNPSTYQIDSTQTSLQFLSAPGAGQAITVDFHFYFRCRFLDDTQKYEEWASNLWEVKEIRFESVKP